MYVREGVSVWPTKTERITGRLRLIKQHRVLFLSWLPYSAGGLLPDGALHELPSPDPSARGALQAQAVARDLYF